MSRMEQDYFKETKQKFDAAIPDFRSGDFGRVRDKIRKGLEKAEGDQFLLIRKLKTLVLGDWNTPEKRDRLESIKNSLLRSGYYAETIDAYYSPGKGGRLSQRQILEHCCINHQLILFIDGEGTGTVTEQNYLSDNYIFHGKTIFFIETDKFEKYRGNPSCYFMSFPSIIRYEGGKLIEDANAFVSLRIHRLAGIIAMQSRKGRGPNSVRYEPWERRLRSKKLIR